MAIAIGNIVYYRLTALDASSINAMRSKSNYGQNPWVSPTSIVHSRIPANAGDVLPMLVTKVVNSTTNLVNGQVFLDGIDNFWVVESAQETVDLVGNPYPTSAANQGRWSLLPRT